MGNLALIPLFSLKTSGELVSKNLLEKLKIQGEGVI
jgi:hypothetical protein